MASAETKYLNNELHSYSHSQPATSFAIPQEFEVPRGMCWQDRNSNLLKSASWNYQEFLKEQYKQALELFAQRVEDCPIIDKWILEVCANCGEKKHRFRITCLSPYCQNPECIENRKRIAKGYLEALNIKSNNLLHTIFGFEHVEKFTPTIRKAHNKVFSLLEKEMQRLGTPLHMVVVRDINKRKDKKKYIHYHTAQLPVKDFRKFNQNLLIAREKIIKKTGTQFTIQFKGYRNQKGLSKYFINRLVGIFGNVKKQQTYGYSNLIDIKEYFDCFYNRRKIRLLGLRAPEGCSVLAYVLDKPSKKCCYCGHKESIFIYEDVYKPPPPKICSCELHNVARKDWNYQLGLCKWCSPNSELKMQKLQAKFEAYLKYDSEN